MRLFRFIHYMHRLLFDMNYGDRFRVDRIKFEKETNDYFVTYFQIGKRRPLQQSAIEIYKNEKLLSGFSRKDAAKIGRFAGESIEKKRRKQSHER